MENKVYGSKLWYLLLSVFIIIIAFNIPLSFLSIVLLVFSSYILLSRVLYIGRGKDGKLNNIVVRIVKYVILIFIFMFILTQCYLGINIFKNRNNTITLAGNETMIILGAQVNETEPTKVLKDRLDKAVPILKQNPNIKVIVTGFRGPKDQNIESTVMKDYLIKSGITNEIIEDPNAVDTIGNFRNAEILIREHKLNQRIIIVTSDFHMLRSDLIARGNYFEDIKHLRSHTSNIGIKPYLMEFISFNKYYLNKIQRLF